MGRGWREDGWGLAGAKGGGTILLPIDSLTLLIHYWKRTFTDKKCSHDKDARCVWSKIALFCFAISLLRQMFDVKRKIIGECDWPNSEGPDVWPLPFRNILHYFPSRMYKIHPIDMWNTPHGASLAVWPLTSKAKRASCPSVLLITVYF